MRKYHDVLQEKPLRPGRSRVPAAIVLAFCLLAAPLIYEGGKILVARWLTMTGTYSREAETPVLDAIAGWSRDADAGARRYSAGLLYGGSWRPSTAVPIAITWALLMTVIFLRRAR